MAATEVQAETAFANPDAAIVNAWSRRVEAWRQYNALPCDAEPETTKAEQAVWAIIDDAENEIRTAVARTPEGIAIQLWAALASLSASNYREDEEAVARRDLAHLESKAAGFEWGDRNVIAALRSLRGMESLS